MKGNRSLYTLLVLVLAVLLAGCQSAVIRYENPYDNPRSVPPEGTIVKLNQPLQFPVGSSRSYVQYGEAQPRGGVNEREPYCMFYLYEPSEALKQVRTIAADKFLVKKSFQGAGYASIEPVHQASILMFDDGPSARTLTTTLRLESATQPQVHEMRCSVFGDVYNYGFVSVNKIIKTLGDVATLQLPTAAQ